METEDGFVYTINGVRVIFPCKAYPTQLCMMDKIIKGVERHQNSLLESPTGSGKSLALLCSCLAWQTAEYEKKAKMDKKLNDVVLGNGCCSTSSDSGNEMPLPLEHQEEDAKVDHKINEEIIHVESEKPQETETCSTPLQTSVPNKSNSPTDEDFQPAKKRFRTPANQQAVGSSKRRRVQIPQGVCFDDEEDHSPPDWRMELTTDASRENASPGTTEGCEKKDKCSPSDDTKGKGNSEKIKIPKIYFGTRTHKQIAQITRELGKTQYKNARMTILSSREHSCVHPVVSRNKNKNEECKKLLDGSEGGTCRYYHKVHTISTQASIRLQGLDKAWDIEDLVTLGNRVKACPYYGARELMKEADIIFCPYNYLIDPKIRMQMEISLKDQIVVLDEAHNVEDSARDAASLSITAVDLQEVLDDLDKMISIGVLPEQHRSLHLLVASLLKWIDASSLQLKERGFEQAYKVWAGMEIVAALGQQGITPATFFIHWEHFEFILASLKDPNRQRNSYSLSSQSISRLEGIFLVAKYMLGNDMKHIEDYRAAVIKTAVMLRNENLGGRWRRSRGGMRKEWTHSLHFWCLNPAVVFSELGSMTRCIILTSGTLSPMASFSSELGIAFPIQLEANHVVANSQVWVGTLSAGPNGSAINASYHSAETFAFQDEVGRMVLNVCETVPHGVLCFFPSYNMLDKLSKRWQTTGLWSQLVDRKIIVSEPRSGDKLEFDDIMHQFYHAVRASEVEKPNDEDSDDESSVDGGLFLAVCRGKVSEGLDFADNNARAVITIGIPFPNVKDVQVELKRKYNNMHASSRGLLTGSEWYEIQAYRALNQALGRCIRHKQDWGAILLIDERFNKSQKYTNGISKWVRHRIKRFVDFGAAMSSLKGFASARRIEPCPAIPSPHTLSQQNTSTVGTPGRDTSTASCMVDITNSNIKPPVAPTPFHTPRGNTSISVYHVSTPTPTVLDACDITPKTLCFNTELEDSRYDPKHVPDQTDKRAMTGETVPSASLIIGKLGEIPSSKLRDCDRETPSDVMETDFSSSPVLFSTPCSSRSVSPVAVVGENISCPLQETTQGGDKVYNCSVDDVNSLEITTCVNNVKPVVSKEPITTVEESNDVTQVTTIRKLFKSGRSRDNEPVKDENGLRTESRGILVDDVNEKMNQGSFNRENCVETAVKEGEICLNEDNCYANGQNSEGNSHIRRKSSIPKNERGQRGNLRRGQMKNSRKNSTTYENHAVYEKADETDRSSVLFCSRCGCHLLTGPVSPEPVQASVLDRLCGSGSMLNEKAVLKAGKGSCESSPNMCPLVHLSSDQTSAGFKLNSVYVSETECCYIPQVCRVCLTNGDSTVIGLEVVSLKANTVHSQAGDPRHFRTGKQVWLFENSVTCGKHNR